MLGDAAVPTAKGERYAVMDVLRGFALFGVMLINIYEFGGEDILITSDQLAALPSASLNETITFWVRLFVADKANTLFAFLFGLGFWVQMERLEARGTPFKAVYLRRAFILLLFGWLHVFGLFAWDILHVYGTAAFILFFCRKFPDRALLWIGIVLLLFAKPVINYGFEVAGISGQLEEAFSSDATVLAQQTAAQSGDFPAFLSLMARNTIFGWLLTGGFVAWVFYALGRFFMGAWVARKGWIQNASTNLSLFRRWLWPCLIAGFLLELAHLLTEDMVDGLAFGMLAVTAHAVATPLIAAGYVCALVLIFHGKTVAWLVKPLAPVGQMALTNYVSQSVAIILILTSVGPGLGLAGKAGISTFLPLVIAFFTAQIVFSHVWMKAFAFGPLEWLWRALTYGTLPSMRRIPQPIKT